MVISRILLCIGLAAGSLSTYDTLSQLGIRVTKPRDWRSVRRIRTIMLFENLRPKWEPQSSCSTLSSGPRHGGITHFGLSWQSPLSFYYGGWWLPWPLLGLHIPNRVAAIDHVIASVFSLAGIAMAYPHFALGALSNEPKGIKDSSARATVGPRQKEEEQIRISNLG